MIEIKINKVVDALIEMSKFMRTDYKTTWGKIYPWVYYKSIYMGRSGEWIKCKEHVVIKS